MVDKKSANLILIFGILLILSFSLISASWFSDLWNKITGKNEITGQVTSGTCIGTATPCSSFTTPDTCVSQARCVFGSAAFSSLCGGEVTPCSSMTSESSCTAQRGCSWNPTIVTSGQILSFKTDKNSYIVGETATFTISVKNIGTTIWNGLGPESGAVYGQSQTFSDLGFPVNETQNTGKTRVAVGQGYPDYPWRWNTGNLAPGQSANITGKVSWEKAGNYTLCAGVVNEWIAWMDKNKFCKTIIVSSTSSICETGYTCLDSDNPKITVNFNNVSYIVELISATERTATIKIIDSSGYVGSSEINKGSSIGFWGIDVYLKSVNITNSKINVVLKLSPIIITAKCTDTDGGINESEIGVTQRGFARVDYCTNDKDLTEFYCNDNSDLINNITINCPKGCYNGRCINFPFDVVIDKTEGFAPLIVNYNITKDNENSSCLIDYIATNCSGSWNFFEPGNYTFNLGIIRSENSEIIHKSFNITVFSSDFLIRNFKPSVINLKNTKIYFEDVFKNNLSVPDKINIAIYKISENWSKEKIDEKNFSCNKINTDSENTTCVIEFNYNFPEEGEYKFLIQNLDTNGKEVDTYDNEKPVFVFQTQKSVEDNKFPIGLWTYAGRGLDIVKLNQFNSIKELGIDTIIDGKRGFELPGADFYTIKNYNKRLLFFSQNNGIRVMLTNTPLSDPNLPGEQISDSVLRTNESHYQDFKSFYRYYLNDEPSNKNEINSIKYIVHVLDEIGAIPGTTTLVNDLDLIRYYYQNVDSQEVIVDYYPLDSNTPKEGEGLQEKFDKLAQTLKELNNLSKVYNKPFWFFVQAHSWQDQLRDPTPNEIRAMTNLALAYGAKGIFYFYYWTEQGSRGLVERDAYGNVIPNEKYYEIKALNQNIKKIRDTLIDLKNIGTCNSKMIGLSKGESLISDNWHFDEKGWDYITSQDNDGSLNLQFNGNNLNNLKDKEDKWFDFYSPVNINTTNDKIIEINYEILKNPNNLAFYFNPKRQDQIIENIYLPSFEGSHNFIINLKNLKGSGNINKMEFFIDNTNTGGFDLKINSIKDYNCELPYVNNISGGNIEVGNFVHKNGDKYLFLVNRDTNNPATIKIRLNDDLGEIYLYDVLTGSTIYHDSDSKYSFSYSLNPGGGRLIKIIPIPLISRIMERIKDFIS